jgi:hypothetical protein
MGNDSRAEKRAFRDQALCDSRMMSSEYARTTLALE